MDEAKSVINDALMKCEASRISGWSNIKNTIKDTLKNFLWQKMKRRPNDTADNYGSITTV